MDTPFQSVTPQREKPKRTRTTHRKTEADLQDLGVSTTFAKSGRRKRTAYSDAEDQAILEGFRKYGQKWSQIQQDENLGLDSRMPMDLRDRMRNRWPEEYAKAGLKLRAESSTDGKAPAKSKSRAKSDGERSPKAPPLSRTQPPTNNSINTQGTGPDQPTSSRPEKENKEPPTTSLPAKKIPE